MAVGISAQGTMIEYSANVSPASFTEIPHVRSISGPSETSDELQFTHLKSLGGRREYIQSFRDSDDLTLEMNYLAGNAVQAALRDAYESGATLIFRVTYPDTGTAIFNGFVKARSTPAAVGDLLVFNVTVRISGQVDYTAGV